MSTNRILRAGRGAVGLCALALAVGIAKADLPDVVFEITAEVGPISVTVPILSEWGEYDPETHVWTWQLPEAMDFWSDDVFLGTLSQFDATLVQDPEVNLNFAVEAGPEGSTFHIASSQIMFDTIPAEFAMGRASAAFTLTDSSGNFDGATLTGIGAMGGAYLAQYNGWAGNPMGPDGITFAEGIFSMSAGPGGIVDETYNEPESGYADIGDDVSSMSSLISFDLSASDSASGTSIFWVVPEPGALGLLALGAIALLRRRP
jgi:MYXO-CTERM domain-containing protein